MQQVHIAEKRLAKLFDITPRYVRELFSNQRVRPGVYDLLKCISAYVQQADGRKEEVELSRIKAETAQFKLDVLKRDYLPVEEVEIVLGDMINKIKSKIRAIPSKGSRLLEGETDRLKIEAILKEFTDEVLRGLSEYEEMEWKDEEEDV